MYKLSRAFNSKANGLIIFFSYPNPLLASIEFIVILGYPIIGKSVILLVNINCFQLQEVFTSRRCTIIQIDRRLPWLLDCHF